MVVNVSRQGYYAINVDINVENITKLYDVD